MEARLASETDLAGFREEAQALLAHRVPPESVEWQTVHAENAESFADLAGPGAGGVLPKAASAIVPASFLRLCEVVVMHHDPNRFALLYRLLWRLVHEPSLRHDAVDGDMLHAHQMAQAVRRDIHKMKTLVKFSDGAEALAPQMAYHDPVHHIVEHVATWFARRMPQQRWVIFTPVQSVECDGRRLHFGPGLARADVPRDGRRESWMACYRQVFGAHAIAVGDLH